MADSPSERTYTSGEHAGGTTEFNKKKRQPQQPRQLLSCTKCRERKVKCDRTEPCSACCARGSPRDCHFVAEDGNYTPIQQSYALRKLRTENLHLKERLRALKIPVDGDDYDHAASPDSFQHGARSKKSHPTKQKRFHGSSEWRDSIYFGTPGLSSVMVDFGTTNTENSVTLSHAMPRMNTLNSDLPTYPFATLFSAAPDECIPQLLSCLPPRTMLLAYLDAFERRVSTHVPVQLTTNEIERFLVDPRKNAQLCPTMLALLLAVVALGAQYSVWNKGSRRWVADVMKTETRKRNVYIAAAMQALRLSSFMHKPSLLAIQTLIVVEKYLTNSGRFLEAFTLFGTTIRLAHSIGLHRHPKYLDPAPPTEKDCTIRQNMWWHMLHMDEEYSMTLGRPLGISGLGDSGWPCELTTDPTVLQFRDFVNHFTVLARQILSSDRLTNLRIDEFTDALRGLLETIPDLLQFCPSWIRPESTVPDWPLSGIAAGITPHSVLKNANTATVYYCKTHTYLVLLNRQRIEKLTPPSTIDLAIPSFPAVNLVGPSAHPSPTASPKSSLRGRALVLSSCEDILSVFHFFYHRDPGALSDWTLSQQAFNSCMILLSDALECGAVTPGASKAECAFVVFKELDEGGVHGLAAVAVEKISCRLRELHRLVQEVGQRRGDDAATHQTNQTQDRCPTDMVMSNSGMLLLEDPGLQAFAHEAFEPIAWRTPGCTPSTDEYDHHRYRCTTETIKAWGIPNGHVHTLSVDDSIHTSDTRGSAATRYATDDPMQLQLHGFTTPASPTGFRFVSQGIHLPLQNTTGPGPGFDYCAWQKDASRHTHGTNSSFVNAGDGACGQFMHHHNQHAQAHASSSSSSALDSLSMPAACLPPHVVSNPRPDLPRSDRRPVPLSSIAEVVRSTSAFGADVGYAQSSQR
ncbi:hypothetical protein BDW02DRAFT_559327 [Decorospora gaudefroyi]|uniref:Zn(2)-C6 fungal-type domain-containing protein n=1 Tax=Decorospora gaudefroyi TaxID=184978 RepID=A0A6A5K1W4_9PLEO|nr:hypothetical protein BDW02DRAFT_559327 [Decorospora gaudefroyi]